MPDEKLYFGETLVYILLVKEKKKAMRSRIGT